MEQHQEHLNRLCRVCGRYFGSQRNRESVYKCSQYSSELSRVFEINIAKDLDTVHPSNFCKPCRIVVATYMKALNEGKVYKHSTVMFSGWGPHLEDQCSTCEQAKSLQLGGRPKKKAGPGRPSIKDVNSVISHLECIAPYPLVPYTSIMPTASDKQLSVNAECPLCLMVLNSPVELINCGAVVCFQCCCSWLKTADTLSCPCCYEHPLSMSSVRAASNFVQDVIRKISVICTNCTRTLELGHYEQHLNSGCNYLHIESAIEDILLQPESAPLSSIESALQANLVRRSLSMSPDKDVMVVKSLGKPLVLTKLTTPSVQSSVASTKTVKRRVQYLAKVRRYVSGCDTTAQLSQEIRSSTVEERSRILDELISQSGCQVFVSTEHSLAMKANLNIPWNKIRVMRRWLKAWGVQLASEQKMRQRASALIGTNMSAEMIPLLFKHKAGDDEIKPTPLAYIPHLWARIQTLLEQNDVIGVERLTWHNGVIPADELWIKIGGDKGGNTFKFCFQLLNVATPNSVENTCVVAMYSGQDSFVNLKICLERYAQQIADIEAAGWRGKKIRFFLCGDYEFLSEIEGISGASGRHFCLWCFMTHEEIILPPNLECTVQLRTIASLCYDHSRFMSAGGNLKMAKRFNNAIRQPLFPTIPLSQVCPPGLHITMGIFLRLFVLLEEECHKLDCRAVVLDAVSAISYDNFCAALVTKRELMDEMVSLKDTIQCFEQHVIYMLSHGEEEMNAAVELLKLEIEEKKQRLIVVSEEIDKLEVSLKEEFKKEDGPFVKALDNALASFHVKRQAYYSGTFVGNHVHRALKDNNIAILCNSIISTAENYPPLCCEARAISQKYLSLFYLFQKCHNIHDKNTVSDEEIEQLEDSIGTFMAFYRKNFATYSVLPKMHFLEVHVVPFLKRWHMGFGFLGEQGVESIHHYFNDLERTYCGVKDPVQKLQLMMKEHTLHTAPSNVAARPQIKRRKQI